VNIQEREMAESVERDSLKLYIRSTLLMVNTPTSVRINETYEKPTGEGDNYVYMASLYLIRKPTRLALAEYFEITDKTKYYSTCSIPSQSPRKGSIPRYIRDYKLKERVLGQLRLFNLSPDWASEIEAIDDK
jgi:hypothetical protein